MSTVRLANAVWDFIATDDPRTVARGFAAAVVDDEEGKERVLDALELLERAVENQEVRD